MQGCELAREGKLEIGKEMIQCSLNSNIVCAFIICIGIILPVMYNYCFMWLISSDVADCAVVNGLGKAFKWYFIKCFVLF